MFPFQLELDAALPASMTCQHLGAEVYYKLRATAVRSAFSANFHAMKPVFVIKAFSFESLEFNQSLEVEVLLVSPCTVVNQHTHEFRRTPGQAKSCTL